MQFGINSSYCSMDMKQEQTATFRRLWHSVYAAEIACLPLEQSSIWLKVIAWLLRAILALIALVTGPNSTRLCLIQFMPVTREAGSLNYNIPMCDVSCVKAQVNWGHRQQYWGEAKNETAAVEYRWSTRGAVAEVGSLNYMYYIISQFYEWSNVSYQMFE